MSEKIYAWLLRLYPSHFREAYGDEALQLFRDRARDEKGFFPSLRLWLDLLSDLAISVLREYRYVQPELIGASAQQRLDGMPSFYVLRNESPRPGALLFGGVLSLAALVTLSIFLSHAGNYTGQETAASGQPQGHSGVLQQQGLQSKHQDAAGAMHRAMVEDVKLDAATRQRVIAGNYAGQEATASGQPQGHSGVPQQQAPQSKHQDAASATRRAAGKDTKLDAAARQRVIAKAVEYLKQYYIDAEVAQQTANALLAHEKNGDDNAATDSAAFAELLTRQMNDASHDKQLIMVYQTVKLPEEPPGPAPEEIAQFRRELKRNNCTFEKVGVLPHNIGYLKLNSFPPPRVCQAKAAAAMASLNGADAIIFDLRDNHGGAADMVALLATYLFDHPTHLNDFYDRGENSTEQLWTRPPVPGNKLADKPAYVLISATSFSAAEGFSYDLKMLQRATIVGETTSGRSHRGVPHRIDDHFMILVPGMKVINPISKTNWEGAGVEPDVKVKATDALETAEKLAQGKLQKK
jgi:hypothetical protein